MAGTNEIRKTLQEWLENPAWSRYYDTAPSERCREFIALEFYYSDTEDEAAAVKMDEIETTLNINDLKHLVRYAGSNPRKGALLRRIAEMETEAQS